MSTEKVDTWQPCYHYKALVKNLKFVIKVENLLTKSFFHRQRQEDLFCDVILVVQSVQFPAHRNVLSATSDYFKVMFTTNVSYIYSRTRI